MLLSDDNGPAGLNWGDIQAPQVPAHLAFQDALNRLRQTSDYASALGAPGANASQVWMEMAKTGNQPTDADYATQYNKLRNDQLTGDNTKVSMAHNSQLTAHDKQNMADEQVNFDQEQQRNAQYQLVLNSMAGGQSPVATAPGNSSVSAPIQPDASMAMPPRSPAISSAPGSAAAPSAASSTALPPMIMQGNPITPTLAPNSTPTPTPNAAPGSVMQVQPSQASTVTPGAINGRPVAADGMPLNTTMVAATNQPAVMAKLTPQMIATLRAMPAKTGLPALQALMQPSENMIKLREMGLDPNTPQGQYALQTMAGVAQKPTEKMLNDASDQENSSANLLQSLDEYQKAYKAVGGYKLIPGEEKAKLTGLHSQVMFQLKNLDKLGTLKKFDFPVIGDQLGVATEWAPNKEGQLDAQVDVLRRAAIRSLVNARATSRPGGVAPSIATGRDNMTGGDTIGNGPGAQYKIIGVR